MCSCLLVLLPWCVAPCGTMLGAQSIATPPAPTVLAGARVRLWELAAHDLSMPLVGRLAGVTRDSVALRPDGDPTLVAVPRPAVTRIETSAGPASGSRWTSAGIGAIIGGLGGGILGVIAGNLSRSNAARLGIYSAVGGLGGGAAIGATQPGETWRRASLPAAPAP